MSDDFITLGEIRRTRSIRADLDALRAGLDEQDARLGRHRADINRTVEAITAIARHTDYPGVRKPE